VTSEHVAFFEYGSCGMFVDRGENPAESIGRSSAYQGLYSVCHGGCIQVWGENAFFNP